METPDWLVDIRRFVGRDWARLEAAKADYWAERRRALGPTSGLEIGDALRRFAQETHPGWPSAEDERADLEAHQRLSERLRRADVILDR